MPSIKHLLVWLLYFLYHYNDVIMSAMASQITNFKIVYSTVYSGADQRKHQSSASQAFLLGIHRWPVNSPHKGPVTRIMFLFDDIIMIFFSVGYWLLFMVILNKLLCYTLMLCTDIDQASACDRFPVSDLIFIITLVVDGYGICLMTEKPVEQTPFPKWNILVLFTHAK